MDIRKKHEIIAAVERLRELDERFRPVRGLGWYAAHVLSCARSENFITAESILRVLEAAAESPEELDELEKRYKEDINYIRHKALGSLRK